MGGDLLEAFVSEAGPLAAEAADRVVKAVPELEGVRGCVEALILSKALNYLVWGVEDGRPPTPRDAVRHAASTVLEGADVVRVLCRLFKAVSLRLAARASGGGVATLLDVGCGCGAALAAVASYCPAPAPAAVGLDMSYGMLEVLRVLRPDALPVHGVADAIPLRDSSVDELITTYSIHEFPSLKAFMAEVVRVLKPGGRALIVDRFSTPLTRLVSAAGRAVRLTFGKAPENPYGLDEVVESAEGAGLEVIRAWRVGGGLRSFLGVVELVKPP